MFSEQGEVISTEELHEMFDRVDLNSKHYHIL